MRIILLKLLFCTVFSLRTDNEDDKYCNSTFCDISPNKYSKDINLFASKLDEQINEALISFKPCNKTNCGCYKTVIKNDLLSFKEGITKEQSDLASKKGTQYQVIEGVLYREKSCHFPARCAGIEYFLKKIANKLPNMEFTVNTRDWPQVIKSSQHENVPVFSFSKTNHYLDIMYPAWSFWEGGPAISLYPTGIGRWDLHRKSIHSAAKKWPWEKKSAKAFFRGSRTSEERDALVLLSRSHPELVDAQFTKNQAWKSDADTLHSEPATEVSFEDHCAYKYLFNFRGVAASFRFKHLFLCESLVFHVGDDWLEFFYPMLKAWVHYVPVSPRATQEDLSKYLEYFRINDNSAKSIAKRGFQHIWDNLTNENVECYWKTLLKKYAKLLKYEIKKKDDFTKIY